jgi:SAM-dependent methyltransferase
VDLRRSWDTEADRWIRFVRTPGHDHAFSGLGLAAFLELLPPPGRLTLDVGCGEGRLPRFLAERGHRMIGVDSSPMMVRHAAGADPAGRYVIADAAALPVRDGTVDLATAYMTLHDFDDMAGAIGEVARVLSPGGRFCFSIVHPINSGGRFSNPRPDAVFEIKGSYLDENRYRYDSDREGIQCAFHSMHRPLEAYARAFEEAGLLIEALREPKERVVSLKDQPGEARWRRIPLFLFGRAMKPG